ncbi:hypothetical protein MTR67_011184 [Solanum verrucosum]|uniref:Uncharacterized protein n=1 Tax=Solanum verrucosum TaxID=315347 RepID=A0AAF0TGA8_SOLVR|nr:hypothetical protein MTR67_011184 [Solanum verrucosum]
MWGKSLRRVLEKLRGLLLQRFWFWVCR